MRNRNGGAGKIVLSSALLFCFFSGIAQTVFTVSQPNKQLSPYTGMTRAHWKDAALYLLKGAFTHVKQLDDPMQFPKQPGKSYPHSKAQIPTEKLEGLCRTMFLAGPLLKEDPALRIGNISVGEYYRHQIEMLIDSNSSTYIKNRAANGGPSQTLVEFGGLALSLMSAPEVFWEPLPKAMQDALASKMLSYGEGPTIGMNWRFFNINILSFFKSKGYVVNEKYLLDLLDKTLAQYRGDGWYNDSPYFDYYSMWAFQMYGAFWAENFGRKYYPEYAAKFLQNLHDAASHYPYMFGRDGKMIMWGRSMPYRMGASIPFPLMSYTNDASLNYGWMRRIASATILQFLEKSEFLSDNVPTLGFYGAFEPAVQTYSCRGSAYWMAKLFLGLYTPANSQFWTAVENEGPWADSLKPNLVYNQLQQNTDILITDYPGIGAAEIRATTNSKTIGVYQGTENYNRLSYSSEFPWQADGPNGEVAMNYLLKRTADTTWEAGRMFAFKGYKNEVYYRSLSMAADSSVQIELAELPIANGIVRVDKINSSVEVAVRLGHYALPELGTPIRVTTKRVKGYDVKIIDNGRWQLAMVTASGWAKLEAVKCSGLHPEALNSSVAIASTIALPGNTNLPPLVSWMLWKPSGKPFTKQELVPVMTMSIKNTDIELVFRDKSHFNIHHGD
ncbi:MAG TPA: DUF2264 domain-containing protein [Phnomibacter sp.]|nr:DUF2264 domain-containing protein [Phnomibacter sp.]